MKEINSKKIKYFICAFLTSCTLIITNGIAGETELTTLLPQDKALGNNVSAEYLQKAEGEKLVELINGGAVLFFKHGFEQTIFQEYYIDSTQYINLEIYQMNSPEGAKGIFLARSDTAAKKLPFGQQGIQDDYYCTFYRDNFYVIATGSDSTNNIQQVLLKTIELVDAKILAKNNTKE